jgi:hypothetical protein
MPRNPIIDLTPQEPSSEHKQTLEHFGLNSSDPETLTWAFQALSPSKAAEERNKTENALATERCRGHGPQYIKDGNKITYLRIDNLAYHYSRRVVPCS